jgi:hypothetical protein
MMKDLIDKKTVALVGNSQSLFDYQYGSEIDDHDVVIRINDTAIYYDNNRHSHGSRNTIWAFWDVLKFITSQKQYRGPRTDEFFSSGKYHKLNLLGANADRAFELDDVEFGSDIKRKCKKELGNPSAGSILLYLLNEYNPRWVTVYGMDFKRTKTFSHEHNSVDNQRYDSFYRHNFKFEEEYAKQKYFSQERFVIKGN